MTESAPIGDGKVVYPKFGRGTATFEWPEHIDWSECTPDLDGEDQHSSDHTAKVLQFPVPGERS